jgi:hypothetical protein
MTSEARRTIEAGSNEKRHWLHDSILGIILPQAYTLRSLSRIGSIRKAALRRAQPITLVRGFNG